MAAALYDASLDAFYPFSWMDRLNIFRSDDCPVNANFTNRLQAATNLFENWNSNWGFSDRIYPQLPQNIIINFMGYEFARYRTSKSKKMLNEADGPTGGGGPRGAPSSSLGAAPMRSMMAAAQMESEKKSDSFKDSLPAANKPAQPPQPDLDKVSARANLNETAFFFPQLTLDEKGTVTMNFTMPEALTTWKFLGFAHGKKGQSGKLTGETITQKDLMVQPNPPRFLREGDELVFTAKVTNLSEGVQKGKVRFSLRDPGTEQSKDAAFSLQNPDQEFEVPAKESRSFGWRFKVPDGPGLIAFKVVGATEKLSDGEEGVLPVLSRRIFVTESVPLHIKGPGRKGFKLPKLIDSGKSDTLITQTLTVQITSNPAWYAVQALPYLMEFPHECSEQLFNRVYANTLARFIAMSDPRIRKVFDAWKADEPQGGKALLSNLEKNEQLKSILLMETPWVREAKSETEAKHNIGVLFDDNRLNNELSKGKDTLSKMQLSDGSWPWFPGGSGNPFITLYIVTGFGRLRHLGTDIEIDMAVKALDHLDRWIDETYREIVRYGDKDENHLSSTIALYFYGRSFFLKDREIPAHAK